MDVLKGGRLSPEYEVSSDPLPSAGEKRQRMALLDEMIGLLEELNLRDIRYAPMDLVLRMRGIGVPAPSRISPSKALDRVFAEQEKYMAQPKPAKERSLYGRRIQKPF